MSSTSKYKARMATAMRTKGSGSTLGSVSAPKAKKGRRYDKPEAGKLGAMCLKGTHSNCYMLSCGCGCHKGGH